MEASNTAPSPFAKSTNEAAEVWEQEAKGLRKLPLAVAAGVLLISGYVMIVSGGDDADAASAGADQATDDADDADDPTAAEEPAPEQGITAENGSDEGHGTDDSTDTGAGTDGDDGDEEAAVEDGAVDVTVDSGGLRKASKRPAPGFKSDGSKPEPSAKPETAAQPAPAPVRTDEERIAAGLEAGWLRKSGGTLMQFPKPNPVDWESAAKACRRSAGGVKGWKLPTIAQLQSLRKANAVPAGTWWSRTDARDATLALTLTTVKSGSAEASKVDGRAQTICVRKP